MLESTELMDREYLSEISGGDVDFEKELIQAFLEAAPDLIAAFMKAVESNDSAKAIYASHTLKGSSRSIGANQFAMVAEELEKAARVEDMDSCRRLAPDLDVYFRKFAEAGAEFLAAA